MDRETRSSWDKKALAALDVGQYDAALSALIHGYQQTVLGYCIAKLGDRDGALDVAQDVFEAVGKALPRFRRESPFLAWILRIARNRCSNCRRTLGRSRRIFSYGIDKSQWEAQPDPADSPEMAVIKQQQAQRLQRALAKLQRKEREILFLYHIEGLPLQEIADHYSVARETLRQNLIKAQEKLKRLITRLSQYDT
jgi:RNA polymerase sigma-70 factor (ECF subfamily)